MPRSSHVVAIVGGGLSGAALAGLLLSTRSAEIDVHLIEPLGEPAWRRAAGDGGLSRILNVPAGRMSLYAEGPDDFVRWAQLHGPRLGWPLAASANTASYLPRPLFFHYVQSALESAEAWAAADRPTPLVRHTGRIRRLVAAGGRWTVELDGGSRIVADSVVLAPAIRAPATPFAVDGAGDRFIADPTATDALAGVGRDDRLLVAGTGLMMVEVIAALDRARPRGQVTAISPHGLLPRVRGVSEQHPPVLTEADMRQGIRHAVGRLRAAIAEGKADWRTAIDSLRPVLNQLWSTLPVADQDRLERHLRPFWEVHRHRMPAEAADQLLRWAARGQLRIVAGRVLGVVGQAGGAEVVVQPRPFRSRERWRFDWVINCSAPASLLAAPRDHLTETLLAAGLARPNRGGTGFELAAGGRVIDAAGQKLDNLFVVGQARLGHVFDEARIPTLRPQLEALAAHLTRVASHHPGRRKARGDHIS